MFAMDLCSYLSQNYEIPYMEPPQTSSLLLQGHSTSTSSVMASSQLVCFHLGSYRDQVQFFSEFISRLVSVTKYHTRYLGKEEFILALSLKV